MALIESLNTGVSTIKAFTTGMKVIGNNISNVNSIGFKSERIEYSDGFSTTLRRSQPSDGSGAGSNQTSLQLGSGVQINTIAADFSQGAVESTGVKTDLAVVGEGFFTVNDSVNNTNFVTRAGNFRLDDNGYIVSQDGYRLQGLVGGNPTTSPSTVGDIQIDYTPASSGDPTFENFSFDSLGRVAFELSDGSSFIAAQVLLQRFSDPQALNKENNGLYSGIDSAGAIGGTTLTAANNSAGSNGLGAVQANALELSNTDLTQEFANLIVAQRSFQAGARVITVSDSIIDEIVNLKR